MDVPVRTTESVEQLMNNAGSPVTKLLGSTQIEEAGELILQASAKLINMDDAKVYTVSRRKQSLHFLANR
jgi:hypothetical protein